MSIVDVAKIAEVSTATVSRVLNSPQTVRAETADRVHAAMERLGYSLPAVRRGPKIGSRASAAAVKQIAVIAIGKSLRTFEKPAVGAILTGITRAAWEAQLRVLLEEVDANAADIARVLQSGAIAGAILLADSPRPIESLNGATKRLPVVWIANGSSAHVKGVDQVWADDSAIGCMAYQQLADKGCAQFACLCDQPANPSMRSRAQSFAQAAEEDSHSTAFFLQSRDGRGLDSYGSGASQGENLEALTKLLATKLAGKKNVGLFLPTDLLAAQVYPLLYQNKLKPGRDVTVATVSNESIRCSMLIPEPISIDIGSEAIGRAAIECLVHRMLHPTDPPKRMLIAPDLDGQFTSDLD